MPGKTATVSVQNVVASASLKQRLDLDSVLKVLPGVEYKPEQFPGLVYKLKKPRAAILMFSTGKMICTGARSERLAKRAVMKAVEELKRNGIVILAKPDIQVQNIVASGDLYGEIDLEKTTYALKKTIYEPEQFPGLIYRMDEPRTVMLLFTSGKFVCTGARSESQVYEAVKNLKENLEKAKLISYE